MTNSRPEKPPLWSFDRKTEVEAVDRHTRSAKYRQVCYDVIDAVLEIRATGRMTPAHLQTFVRALESPPRASDIVWSSGAKRLAECAHHFPEAGEALVALGNHRRAGVRLNVLAAVQYGPPRDVALALLRRGIRDEDAKVREQAVTEAWRDGAKEILPDLEERLRVEADEQARESLEFAIAFIREGRAIRNGWETRRMPNGEIITRKSFGGST
jgi:hypothetical protein